jgi:hypothetical protein
MSHMNDPAVGNGSHGKSAHGARRRWLPRPLVRLVVAMRTSMAPKPQSWPMARLDKHLLRDIWPDTDECAASRDRIGRPHP